MMMILMMIMMATMMMGTNKHEIKKKGQRNLSPTLENIVICAWCCVFGALSSLRRQKDLSTAVTLIALTHNLCPGPAQTTLRLSGEYLHHRPYILHLLLLHHLLLAPSAAIGRTRIRSRPPGVGIHRLAASIAVYRRSPPPLAQRTSSSSFSPHFPHSLC